MARMNMGGAGAVIQKVRKGYEAGNYRWVAQVLDQVAALLFGSQMAKSDAGDCLQPEAAGGGKPAVAGDDSILGVQKDGVREPELLDVARDLGDLVLGMRPWVARERNQGLQRRLFDPEASGNGSGLILVSPWRVLFPGPLPSCLGHPPRSILTA